MQPNDEAELFLQQLNKESSYPTDGFKRNLRLKLLDHNSKKQPLLVGGFMFHSQFVRYLAVYCLLFLLISGVGIYSVTENNRKTTSKQQTYHQILTEIAKKNFKSTFAPTTSTADTAVGIGVSESLSNASRNLYSFGGTTQNFNYNYSKTTTTLGPAKCMALQRESGTTSSYYFEKSATEYYSKVISFDGDHHLTTYSLSTPDSTYSYLGGEYAIRVMIPENQILPTENRASPTNVSSGSAEPSQGVGSPDIYRLDAPSTTDTKAGDDDILKSLFGDVSDISEKTIDGKQYYVVISKMLLSCDQDPGVKISSITYANGEADTSDEKMNTIYSRIYVLKDTFETVKTEEYLNEVTSAQLIRTMVTESKHNNKTFSEVSQQFTFEYLIPVKTVSKEEQSIENQQQQLISAVGEQLKSKSIWVLFPNNDTLQSMYSLTASNQINSYYRYMMDRGYYPQNTFGDTLYEEMLQSIEQKMADYVEPLISFTFGQTAINGSLEVRIYEKEAEKAKIIGDPENAQATTVTINNESVAASLYKESTSIPGGKGVSTEPYVPENLVQPSQKMTSNNVYAFIYKDHLYVVRLIDVDVTAKLVLTAKDPSVSADYEFVIKQIKSAQDARNVSYSNPGVPVPADDSVVSSDR